MQTITLKVEGISGAKFLEKATNILNSLEGQPRIDFEAIKEYKEGEKIEIPFWDELNDLIATYSDALEKSFSKTKASVEQLKIARKQLKQLLSVIKYYLITYYGGNLVALSTTGYDLSKQSAPVGKLNKPKNFKLLYDNKGGVEVSFARIPGAKSYMVEYKASTDAMWHSHPCTKVKCTLNSLETGKMYQVRVSGVGAHPILVYSDVLNITAP